MASQDTPKSSRRVGRPKGSTKSTPIKHKTEKDRIEAEAAERNIIVARQRDDCKKLAMSIKNARSKATEPGDVGKLVRATEILHGLEREAHDFGNKGQASSAVIVIPLPAETMEQWAILSEQTMPNTKAPTGLKVINSNVSIEDEIQGEPEPDTTPAPDPAQDRGPQAAGGESA